MTTRILNAEIHCRVPTRPTAAPDVHLWNLRGHWVALDANSLVAIGMADDAAAMFQSTGGETFAWGGMFCSTGKPQFSLRGNTTCLKLVLNLTNRCNLDCRYCFVHDAVRRGYAKEQDLPIEAGVRALGLLPGDVNVSFFGGEPLLNWETLVGVTEAAGDLAVQRNKASRFHVTTNATLVDDDRADYLKRAGFSVLVSIDGPEAVHNAQRPAAEGNSHEQTMLGLCALKKAGVSAYARATFDDPDTDLAALLGYFRDLRDDGLITGVSIEPAVLTEGCGTSDLADDAVDRLAARYHEAAEWYAEELQRDKPPLDFAPFRKRLQRLLRPHHVASECGAGVGYLTVNPDGAIHSCHKGECQIGHVDTGVDEHLRTPWRDNRFYARAECVSCWARHLCGGGCRHHRLTLTGELLGSTPAVCRVRRDMLKECLWILAEVGPERLKEVIR